MKVGSLVECIDGKLIHNTIDKLPKEGEVYTVRTIERVGCDVFIRLDEIVNPIRECRNSVTLAVTGEKKPQFNILRFRELQPPMAEEIAELMEECQSLELQNV